MADKDDQVTDGGTTQVNARWANADLSDIDQWAERNGLSRTNAIRYLVKLGLRTALRAEATSRR